MCAVAKKHAACLSTDTDIKKLEKAALGVVGLDANSAPRLAMVGEKLNMAGLPRGYTMIVATRKTGHATFPAISSIAGIAIPRCTQS